MGVGRGGRYDGVKADGRSTFYPNARLSEWALTRVVVVVVSCNRNELRLEKALGKSPTEACADARNPPK